MPPHARCVTRSTWRPCLLVAEWCLQSDAVTNARLQGVGEFDLAGLDELVPLADRVAGPVLCPQLGNPAAALDMAVVAYTLAGPILLQLGNAHSALLHMPTAIAVYIHCRDLIRTLPQTDATADMVVTLQVNIGHQHAKNRCTTAALAALDVAQEAAAAIRDQAKRDRVLDGIALAHANVRGLGGDTEHAAGHLRQVVALRKTAHTPIGIPELADARMLLNLTADRAEQRELAAYSIFDNILVHFSRISQEFLSTLPP